MQGLSHKDKRKLSKDGMLQKQDITVNEKETETQNWTKFSN